MKNYILLVITMFHFLSINAQIDFQERIINDRYYYTKLIKGIHSSDIDGDGDIDILTASFSDRKIAWYENIDGQGTFISQNIICTDFIGAESAISTDIDNDGDLDVISTYAYLDDYKIVWFENLDGFGNFGPPNIITDDSHGAYSINAVDIDGDGDKDILTASSGAHMSENEVYWIENLDGQGSFGSKNVISTSLFGMIKSADFDGDGDLDVLSASSHSIAWFENLDGQGTFGSKQNLYNKTDSYFKITTTDVDNDGDIDVVATSQNYPQFFWFENTDGAGSFSSNINISNASGIRDIEAIDVDNDGDMDIVAGFNHKVAWFENINGSFEPYQIITTNSLGTKGIHVNDINGDGAIDVLSISYFDKVAWYENIDGNGTFGVQQIITNAEYNVKNISANYIDSDDAIDFISITFDNKIVWYKNMDNGNSFSSQNFITNEADGATSVITEDFDNDGDIDVLSSSSIDNKICWYENINGEGEFDIKQIISNNAKGAISVYAADVDNDGDMDVFSASSLDNKIAWYENLDGEGNFGVENIISSNAINAQIVIAKDIDNDGDIDVISASSGDNKIAWYENLDGEGNFGAEKVITTNSINVKSIDVSDIDNDGDVDIVSSSSDYTETHISWYKNIDGTGNFELKQMIDNEHVFNTLSVHLIDIDNDNDLDIIASSYLGDCLKYDVVEWYENLNGNGSFSSNKRIDNFPYETLAFSFSCDVDGDGDIDVVSKTNKRLVWYDNLTLSNTEYNLQKSLIIPNPTKDSFIIQSNTKDLDVKVYNSLGRLVLSKNHTSIINVFELKDGVYFVKIVNNKDKGIGFYKVIKE